MADKVPLPQEDEIDPREEDEARGAGELGDTDKEGAT